MTLNNHRGSYIYISHVGSLYVWWDTERFPQQYSTRAVSTWDNGMERRPKNVLCAPCHSNQIIIQIPTCMTAYMMDGPGGRPYPRTVCCVVRPPTTGQTGHLRSGKYHRMEDLNISFPVSLCQSNLDQWLNVKCSLSHSLRYIIASFIKLAFMCSLAMGMFHLCQWSGKIGMGNLYLVLCQLRRGREWIRHSWH